MLKLNELATEYKKSNSSNILNEIFELLKGEIKEKAKFTFYNKKFIKDKYNFEYFDVKQNKIIVEERVHTFRLCETKQMELKDIEQELNLKVLELLNNYDPKLPFENYFYATLSNWRPSYVQDVNFVKDLDTIREGDLSSNEDEIPMNMDSLPSPEVIDSEVPNIKEMFKKLSKKELQLAKLLIRNPHAKHGELADMMGVTRQRIEQILVDLRKKVKKTLHFSKFLL